MLTSGIPLTVTVDESEFFEYQIKTRVYDENTSFFLVECEPK